MPGTTLFSQAFSDLVEDVIYHGTNLVQGAFDLVCLVALGATVYAASIDGNGPVMGPAAGLAVQASAELPGVAGQDVPATCVAFTDMATPFSHGCITAHVIAETLGT